MSFVHRALASLSRRVERPELLATFYTGARRLLHEEIAVEAVLAAVILAILGGLIAGSFGGWRAARLRPAAALSKVA